MKLFHGTSTKYLDAILRDGIQPRNVTGVDASERFESGVDTLSAQDHVYLCRKSARYAISTPFAETDPEKAHRCLNGQLEFAPMLIEVDSLSLSESNFRPDEDWLSPLVLAQNRLVNQLDLEPGTSEYALARRMTHSLTCRDMAMNADLWEMCLENFGCVAHFGAIPPTAIERVSILPLSFKQFVEIGMVLEGNCMNLPRKVIEQMNNALLKWMTGCSTSIDDWIPNYIRLPKETRRSIMNWTKVRPTFIYPNRA